NSFNKSRCFVASNLVLLTANGLSKQPFKRTADSLDNSNGILIEELWLNKISGLQLDFSRRFHKFDDFANLTR
ncbi:12460_t:CDS:2, partial [Gigaspora rosea]